MTFQSRRKMRLKKVKRLTNNGERKCPNVSEFIPEPLTR